MPDATTLNPPRPAPARPTGAESRPARYEAKLNLALTLMAPAERLPELIEERARWVARYDRFIIRIEAGESPHWDEHVMDYVEVIAILNNRIAAARQEAANGLG